METEVNVGLGAAGQLGRLAQPTDAINAASYFVVLCCCKDSRGGKSTHIRHLSLSTDTCVKEDSSLK